MLCTLYYKINPLFDQGNREYYYEDILHYDDLSHHSNLMYADFAWREDSTGISVIKDRMTGITRKLTTEEELKEFMWIKLKSHKL